MANSCMYSDYVLIFSSFCFMTCFEGFGKKNVITSCTFFLMYASLDQNVVILTIIVVDIDSRYEKQKSSTGD